MPLCCLHVQAVPALTRLEICGTLVTEQGLHALTGLRHLSWLCLEAQPPSGALPCITALTGLTCLQVLHIPPTLKGCCPVIDDDISPCSRPPLIS